uniref:inosine/xanthosine triphosphatase n=1 Tax=Neobodo designis TaxID=312471 RepID=A0A7S1Q811_NEODS
MRFAVGTTNAAKLACVRSVVERVFPVPEGQPPHEVVGIAVPSGVNAQPFSLEETRTGALHRAKAALEATQNAETTEEADFGIGLEGGVETCGEQYFECGWMAVVQRGSGRVGWGSSARFELSRKIVDQLRAGKELAEVMTALSGIENVGQKGGAMGVLTNGNLNRADAYAHGLIFAFAPFLSDPERYWD